MQVKKFKGYLITDQKAKIGDTTINTNRKSSNYGLTSAVQTLLIDNDDWKVIVPQATAFDILEIVADTKKVKKSFEKIGVHWSIEALLDGVIEKRPRVIFDDVREMCLQLLPKDK